MWDMIATAQSPRYYNVTAGSDANNDQNASTDRPDTLGRNTFRGDDMMSMDLRLGRRFRVAEGVSLHATAYFFNLFNPVNITDLNTVYGRPTLGLLPASTFNTPRAVGNALQAQFGFRLDF
jgi:hypothetical protein